MAEKCSASLCVAPLARTIEDSSALTSSCVVVEIPPGNDNQTFEKLEALRSRHRNATVSPSRAG